VIEQEQKRVYGLKANTYMLDEWLTAALVSSKGCTVAELDHMATSLAPVRIGRFRLWRNDGVAAASSDGGPTGGRGPRQFYFILNQRGGALTYKKVTGAPGWLRYASGFRGGASGSCPSPQT